MKLSARRAGLLGVLSVLSLALALGGLNSVSAQTTPANVDYDGDNDGLIDVTTPAQMNAIRYDLNGDGVVSRTDSAKYANAFPSALSNMGCPSTGCVGYELLNDLTFDANGDDVVDSADTYPSWTPIGGGSSPFSATFDGGGHVISHLKISGGALEVGLFGKLSGATVRNLGLLEADVVSTATHADSAAGALAGATTGDVSNVYATGNVSGSAQNVGGLVGLANAGALITSSWTNVAVSSTGGGANVGGLLGSANASDIFAACALGGVSASGASANAGGLVGLAKGASVKIRAACARGDVSAAGAVAGGFLGKKDDATALNIEASYSTGRATGATSGAFIASGSATVSDSYWDSTTSAAADDPDTTSPEGKTTSALQTPTAASDIYANWDDLDLTDDDEDNADDDPWDFGTSSQYPAISFGSITASVQRDTDYDGDDDGFIDVTKMAQLNAIRYDLDGDGAASRTDSASYAAAFPNAPSGMGCPSAGCKGYELKDGLTFDTDGDGDVDSDDSYPNWTPIGMSDDDAFAATFAGNGRTISKLKMNSAAARVGLFGSVSSSAAVKGVRLLDVALTASEATANAGAVAGKNSGTISASYAAGTVSSSGAGAANVGALVGANAGTISTSHAAATVSSSGAGAAKVGGLAGANSGTISASHAAGTVSSSGADGASVGGLAGANSGTISSSYAAGTVSSSGTAANVGGLAGSNSGTISASYAAEIVSSSGTAASVGGLVGNGSGNIYASWARASVSAAGASCNVGGLAGKIESGGVTASYARGAATASGAFASVGGLIGKTAGTGNTVSASYSTGKPTASGTGATAGGLIGSAAGTTFAASYWDTTTSGEADDADANQPEGKTTADLQAPTAATGIYSDWDDLDLTDDSAVNAVDDPWTFGSNVQYPVLAWGGLRASDQYSDYDADDDGLIDVTAPAQLNAIRYDLNGDGMAADTDKAKYAAAFSNALSDMGCPATGCKGYELENDLTFDTNRDGYVTAADSYPNWTPIGASDVAAFAATFDGNGKSISKMTINSAAARVGLFGSVSSSATVKGVRLLDVDLTATGTTAGAGALAGRNAGTISASYAIGTVSSTGTGAANVGGLVGESAGNIYASWTRVSVSAAGADGNVGGLVGKVESAAVTAAYARGPVSSSGANAAVGGLIGETAGSGNTVSASFSTGAPTASGTGADSGGLIASVTATIFSASYWDAHTSGVADDSDADSPEGKTTKELQAPTAATGLYADWDDLDLTDDDTANAVDDPWDFGTSARYPALIWGGLSAAEQYDDHDADDDSLLEITSLRQLNAVRYDLDGNGAASQADTAKYAAAFHNAASGMGCPAGGCKGYELAKDLTFDTDGDGDVDNSDLYPNWTPIGTSDNAFASTFDGNGKTISKMKINSAAPRVGLFGDISAAGIIKGVGLLDADVNATYSGPGFVGALAGKNTGTITASYATGRVSSAAKTVGGFAGRNVLTGWIAACWANVSVSSSHTLGRSGGFVGTNYATIVASYSRGDVSTLGKNVGGFAGVVGRDAGANVTASYSTGKVTGGRYSGPRGFVPHIWNSPAAYVSYSYWDRDSSGVGDDPGVSTKGRGVSTYDLQRLTGYYGIYANWDDLDLTNDGKNNPVDDPWDFGTSKQYPVLVWGGLRAEDQYRDYDADDDGLIEITTLRHLDGTRYDLNGDGSADSAASYPKYAAAFPYAAGGMGCPSTGCKGYELDANLTFDTDGNGNVNNSDAYPNWTPIGNAANGFGAEFNGNGKTISKMKISRAVSDIGLFGSVSSTGIVKGVGLLEVSVTAAKGARVGALAGENAGTITTSYAEGTVSATSTTSAYSAGGLVGSSAGMIAASWANVTVASAGYQDSVGGLAGTNYGKIFAAYAKGGVTATGARAVAGGLAGGSVSTAADIKSSYSTGAASATGTASTAAAFVGWGNGQISDSYWDATTSGAADDADAASPEGKTTAALQSPTSAAGIYANWNDLDLTNDGITNAVDDPWDFGTSSQYPVLVWGDLKAGSQGR